MQLTTDEAEVSINRFSKENSIRIDFQSSDKLPAHSRNVHSVVAFDNNGKKHYHPLL